MKGIHVHLMERKGKCCNCGYVIEKGKIVLFLKSITTSTDIVDLVLSRVLRRN